jgi:hypothetical protein
MAVFLIYYHFKLPLIIANSGEHIPTLLLVYKYIHFANITFVSFTLYCILRKQKFEIKYITTNLIKVAPWILISLIFYIPGTYLEFPSDCWEHLNRITHWAEKNTIDEIYKSFGYSIPYSILINNSGNINFGILDIYTTFISLILCWQYYRLSVTIGFNSRNSLLFVILQLFTFGNSSFSFYKYYVLASTIYSQIAAIALLRITLDLVSNKNTELNSLSNIRNLIKIILKYIILLIFIALTHIQGIAISIMALLAISIWRLVTLNKYFILLSITLITILNIFIIIYYPENKFIKDNLIASGLINKFYTFNIFDIKSIAFHRMYEIIGALGLINAIAGLFLIFQNNIIGWLTIIPFIVLTLPMFSLAFISAIIYNKETSNTYEHILIFNRLFLIIPSGLAFYKILTSSNFYVNIIKCYNQKYILLIILTISLFLLTTTPSSNGYFNRFWNTLYIPPKDISMKELSTKFDYMNNNTKNSIILTDPTLGFIINSSYNITLPISNRIYSHTFVNDILYANSLINHNGNYIIINPAWNYQYTYISYASLCSKHWLPQIYIINQYRYLYFLQNSLKNKNQIKFTFIKDN